MDNDFSIFYIVWTNDFIYNELLNVVQTGKNKPYETGGTFLHLIK